MRYRGLILDHDDTAVDSTREIHYPAHVEVMKRLRPDKPAITLEDWYRRNFDPGIMAYLREELGLNDSELETQYAIWHSYATTRIPHFYDGFLDLLREYRNRGGKIAVVSHSERYIIERDYRTGAATDELVPDLIFGWNHDENLRKPSPWPVRQILSAFGFSPEEVLIVDDLKPAVLMGQSSGVAVAGAGWGHHIPEIRRYMQQNCIAYFSTVAELRSFLLE